MKIKVNKKSLMDCFNTVNQAVDPKAAIPVTGCFLFVIMDKKCRIYAFNGELQIQGLIQVDSKEDFCMCIPSHTVMNTIKDLKDEELTFNYNDEKFILNIVANKKRYKITGYNPKEFPIQSIDKEESIYLKTQSSKIIDHIKTISSIVDWGEMRPALSGLTMIFNKGLLEITGVHSAFYFYRGMTSIRSENEFSAILPKNISIAIKNAKGKGDIEMHVGKRKISIKMDGFEYVSSLINVKNPLIVEKYLNYDREKYIIINKNELLGSLRRLFYYCSDNHSILLSIKGGELILSSENENYNIDGEEILEIENKYSKDRIVGLNINYLLSILVNIKGDKIKFFESIDKARVFCLQDLDNSDNSEIWGLCELMISKPL